MAGAEGRHPGKDDELCASTQRRYPSVTRYPALSAVRKPENTGLSGVGDERCAQSYPLLIVTRPEPTLHPAGQDFATRPLRSRLPRSRRQTSATEAVASGLLLGSERRSLENRPFAYPSPVASNMESRT